MKTPPKHTWEKIFEIFAKFDCEVYIFGVGEEAALLQNLLAENADEKRTENLNERQIYANLAAIDTSEIYGGLENTNEKQTKAQICSENSTGGESNLSSQICDTYVKKFAQNELKIISLIDKIKLEELPFYLSQMQLYASSDTGNYYVADSVRTPTICLMGPCFASEQRGVADSLVITSHLPPVSSVFKTVRDIDASAFFELGEQNLADIEAFVKVRYISYLSREDNFLC